MSRTALVSSSKTRVRASFDIRASETTSSERFCTSIAIDDERTTTNPSDGTINCYYVAIPGVDVVRG